MIEQLLADAYEKSLKNYRDIRNIVDTSREEGRIEGLIEGQEIGEKKGRKIGEEIGQKKESDINIKNGIKKGYTDEIIADITGRNIEDVQRIREEMERGDE